MSSLGANLAVATNKPLGAGQFLKTHRASGMELLSRDSNFGTETELAAVGEASGSIHDDRGRIYFR